MPKDNFTNLGLGSNEMFSVSFYLASYVKHRLLFSILPHMSSICNLKEQFLNIK